MTWRNEPITDRQMKYISDMQEFSEMPIPLFTGTTKGEASDYIDKYAKIAHETLYNAHEDAGDRI